MRHKHRIKPGYEGGEYCEGNVVSLTVTQHAMWHFAEWQRKGNAEDKLAWKMLSGQITNQELQSERSRLGAAKLHLEKDDLGRSLVAVKVGKILHQNKDKDGKSINAIKGGMSLHTIKDSDGKSSHARKMNAARKNIGLKEIIVTHIATEREMRFKSLKEACETLSLSAGKLSEVANGRRQKTKGYTAFYVG